MDTGTCKTTGSKKHHHKTVSHNTMICRYVSCVAESDMNRRKVSRVIPRWRNQKQYRLHEFVHARMYGKLSQHTMHQHQDMPLFLASDINRRNGQSFSTAAEDTSLSQPRIRTHMHGRHVITAHNALASCESFIVLSPSTRLQRHVLGGEVGDLLRP